MVPRETILLICWIFWVTICCSAQPNPYSKCPEPETVIPCQCEKRCDVCLATIACANITSMETLYQVMEKSGDFPFRSAEFRDSVFGYIPSLVFETKAYRVLDLKNCTFTSLLDEPVKGDPPLFWLQLDNVRVHRGASFDFFLNFKRLRFLVLRNMVVRKISRSMMEDLPAELETLEFNNTRTDRIDSAAFSRFYQLANLYVVNGNVKKIEASMFPSSLTQLFLSHNKIKSIPADFIQALPRCFNIYLDGNLITTLDQAAIGNAPFGVGYIHLDENPVICNCQVRWIVGQKRPTILGHCKDRDGKDFKDLTEEDFNYC